MPQVLLPDLTFVDGELKPGLAVSVGDDGRIEALGAPPPTGGLRLAGRALLPGLRNAHSHAFQRLLRGRTEWRAAGADDFWTWRQRMYRVAAALSPEQLEDVSAFAFLEMARAGITSVGEFHYLFRDPLGRPYADANELPRRVVRAARRVGLEIVLLRTAYARGGANRALEGAQTRFALTSIGDFVHDTEALDKELASDAGASVGVAAHSVRALHPQQLQELGAATADRVWPIHMHVAEQPREIDDCLAETGLRPVQLIAKSGLLTHRFCAVHAIHLKPAEIAALGQARASVCACPTTERDLGDGVVPAAELRKAGVSLALGSDSQAQIDLLEEARSLELNLRLIHGHRVLFDDIEEQRSALSRSLFDVATAGGARALGLSLATLTVGAPANFFTVDLEDPSLVGAPEDVFATLVFSGQTRAIADVMVRGKFVIRDHHHPEEQAIAERYRALARDL